MTYICFYIYVAVGRAKRLALGGYVYHVLKPAYGRIRIFRKNGDFLTFKQILEDVGRRIKENPEESIGFGSELFGLKEDIFRRALHRDLANWEIEAKIDLVGLKNCLQIQEQMGAIPCDLVNEEMVCHFALSLFQASLRLM